MDTPFTPPTAFAVVASLALATSLGSVVWSLLPTGAQDIEAAAPLVALVALVIMRVTRRRWWGVGRLAVFVNLTLVPGLLVINRHIDNTPDGFSLLDLPVAIAAIFCGLGFFLILRDWASGLPERRSLHPIPLTLLSALIAFAYFGCVTELANEQLDRSQPQFFRPVVTSKGSSVPRRARTRFYVGLASFGSWTASSLWKVTSQDYARLSVGRPACVTAHAGAFGVRWVVVQSCA
jgi:hypothetical protein